MTSFWRKWMTGWCWAAALFGIVLAGSAFEATRGPIRLIFALMNHGSEPEFTAHLRFSLALLGAVTIGWSLTLWTAIYAANQLGKPLGQSVWRLITASVIVWYVIDSALSIATGFGLNAVSNTIFLVTFLLPVFRSGVLRNETSEVSASAAQAPVR